MDPTALIPSPEPIPAPWWLFEALDILLFTVHILLVNVVVGGTILLFVHLARGQERSAGLLQDVPKKLPSTLALAITIGIAPLLFVQVVYGHLFYSSSILMAVGWMLIIPLLIFAYYGVYIQARSANRGLAMAASAIALLIFLYIGLMFTNNMTLMLQPEKWTAYFSHRGGTYLNLDDPTILPRYLHFVFASVAIGGLFTAWFWNEREKKGNVDAFLKRKQSLQIFAFATIAQMLAGFWWLIALPRDIMLDFMGGVIIHSIMLMLGILLAIGALVMALMNKFMGTLLHTLVLLLTMAVMRALLRFSYINDFFSFGDLELKPQYDVLALFLIILLLGLAAVYWMVQQVRKAQPREVSA